MRRHGLCRPIRLLRATLPVDPPLLAFRPKRPVNVHVITAETEGAVVSNIKRKEAEAEATYNSMIAHMKDLNAAALHGQSLRNKTIYRPTVPMVLPSSWRRDMMNYRLGSRIRVSRQWQSASYSGVSPQRKLRLSLTAFLFGK